MGVSAMKINKSTGATSAANVERAGAGKLSAVTAKAAAPADEMTLLGVPDAELTPKVRAALMTLIEDVRVLRSELDQTRARISDLEGLADRDPMLNVFNRRAFARELDRALAMIDRYQAQVSLLFIDLNDLKKINDDLGHAAGDAALEHVAKMLTGNVRQTDVVARIGGDEFAVLLVQADEAIASAKGKQIAAMIDAVRVDWHGAPFHAGVSWGAIEITDGISAQEAMTLADEAMYAAKKQK